MQKEYDVRCHVNINVYETRSENVQKLARGSLYNIILTRFIKVCNK